MKLLFFPLPIATDHVTRCSPCGRHGIRSSICERNCWTLDSRILMTLRYHFKQVQTAVFLFLVFYKRAIHPSYKTHKTRAPKSHILPSENKTYKVIQNNFVQSDKTGEQLACRYSHIHYSRIFREISLYPTVLSSKSDSR